MERAIAKNAFEFSNLLFFILYLTQKLYYNIFIVSIKIYKFEHVTQMISLLYQEYDENHRVVSLNIFLQRGLNQEACVIFGFNKLYRTNFNF